MPDPDCLKTQPSVGERAVREGLSQGTILKSTYRIERLLAMGGMGAVHEAEHVRLGRRVAVKVLMGDAEWSPEQVTRLQQEAEIIARLEHPHIVQVIDVDKTDAGVPYLVMEYLQGETLATRLEREGPLSVVEALRITSDIAAALAQVHGGGIVHCDLKPGNVFLVKVDNEPDFVKLFDFGISRVPNNSDAPPSVVAGTLRYMPPEQTHGEPHLDARADQFALAAVVYEMLSGQPAFAFERPPRSIATSQRLPLRNLSEAAPWVPAELDTVLARALSPAREGRYPSVSRFAWELTNAAIRAGVDTDGEWSGPGSGLRPRRGAERNGVDASHFTAEFEQDTRVESTAPWHRNVDQLLAAARSAFDDNQLDSAVEHAECVLELALREYEGQELATLASHMPLLDQIFEARLGAVSGPVSVGPISDALNRQLSLQARQLLSLADGPMTTEQLLQNAKISRRDGTRLVAGLLRRGILVAE